MGWLWSSPQPAASKPPKPDPNPSSESAKPSPPPKQPEPEYSDPEIAKFMGQLEAEFNSSKDSKVAKAAPPPSSSSSSSSSPPAAPPQPPSSSSSSSSWGSSLFGSTPSPAAPSPTPSPPAPSAKVRETWTPTQLDPISESLLPTSMSCRQAFDAAFHCNSLGGQWTAVYREGALRACGEQWDDFLFCMRARALTSPHKENAIRDRFRRKEYAKYFAPDRPSSADVWKPRDEKAEPGEAFAVPFAAHDVDDEEWRRQEIERRRKMKEAQEAQEARDPPFAVFSLDSEEWRQHQARREKLVEELREKHGGDVQRVITIWFPPKNP
ncbi:hypothetical protein F4781DRAFT_380355 [Annulohypoxylon bovei var. microspora]|nr:hypothetical protein F4781DRAFT_380355 [Annulohypoxylon bovei var. microspora]